MSDTISMHGFEIPTVESFVQFLYTGDYANTKQEGQEGSQQDGNVRPELLGHIHCREIASRFKVDRLMNPSRAKLEALIDKHQDSSDLGSALPAAIRLAHTVSTSQDVMDLLSASVARNIDELMDDDLLSNISDVPEFLLAVLKHSARNASQLKTERAKRMQELKEQEQTASTIPEGSLKLPRDTKSWINNYCKMSFNAEFTDAFELICRGCHSNQDLAKFQKPNPPRYSSVLLPHTSTSLRLKQGDVRRRLRNTFASMEFGC